MIIFDRASLAVYSDATTAATISEVLRLTPTESHEKGDPNWAARAGRDGSVYKLVETRAYWSLDADGADADQSDETGFRALRVLLDVLSTRVSDIASLRDTCETVIWWSGDSDSTQGGFVLPVDMMRDLTTLGCDLYGTTFLDSSDETLFAHVVRLVQSQFDRRRRRRARIRARRASQNQ